LDREFRSTERMMVALGGVLIVFLAAVIYNSVDALGARNTAITLSTIVAVMALAGLVANVVWSGLEAVIGRVPRRDHGSAPVDESADAIAKEADRDRPQQRVNDQTEARFWTPQNTALVVVAVIAAIPGLLQSWGQHDSPPDCVKYAQQLVALDKAYSPKQLEKALKHLRFNRYESACGDATAIVRSLHT
jgi:hypothetical protein